MQTITITSLDEVWPVPETARTLLYFTECGSKFTIFDVRPIKYSLTQEAPDDTYFVFLGGDGQNHVVGNNVFNRIYGYGGDDILHGGSNFDIIFGGSGNDRIYGYDGNDKLDGGFGSDTIYGMPGNDFISGGGHDDFLFGGKGDDTIHGGLGNDFIQGGEDNDILYGYRGIDVIAGNGGDDIIFAGRGPDWIWGGTGTNTINTGTGKDLIWVESRAGLKDGLHIVTDFTKDDDIAVSLPISDQSSLGEILFHLDIRWETGQYQDYLSSTNDVDTGDAIIYRTNGTERLDDDYVFIVLEDYDVSLTAGDFSIL